VKAIFAAIGLAISAVSGAVKIWGIAKGSGTSVEKVEGIRDQLAKIIDKFQALAKNTDPTWDDALADSLAGFLDIIAENLIEQLEGT